MHINDKINVSVKAICRVAAKTTKPYKFVGTREHAGSLFQAARLVQSMELTDKNNFGEGCHIFNICVHLQNISTIIVFNTQKKYAFLPQREIQKGGGEIAPFRTSVSSCH